MVPEAAICKYTKISLQKTLFNLKLILYILAKTKESMKKNTRTISSKLDKLSATAMEYLSVIRMSSKAQLE